MYDTELECIQSRLDASFSTLPSFCKLHSATSLTFLSSHCAYIVILACMNCI